MPLDPVQLAREIVGGLEEDEDQGIDPRALARELSGLPPEEEEGLDLLQPVRTFFGATQGIGGRALGALYPEEYEAARGEMRAGFGVEEGAPWYEEAEALPGVGDVAAQFADPETREGLLGRAVGPALRMVGNIVGDPTTYVGGFAAKGALAAVKGMRGGTALLKTTREAARGRKLAVRSGAMTRATANAENLKDAGRIADLALKEGTPSQLRAYRAGIGLAQGGPLAMGIGAAAAYGPEALQATVEGAKRTYEAEGAGETAAEAANTLLMGGLTALMGKGVIDAATATRAYTQHLRDTKQLPEAIERMEAGIAEEAGIPRVAEGPVPTPEVPRETPAELAMLADEDAARPVDEGVSPERVEEAVLPEEPILEGEPIREEPILEGEPIPEPEVVLEGEPIPEAPVDPQAARIAQMEGMLDEAGLDLAARYERAFGYDREGALDAVLEVHDLEPPPLAAPEVLPEERRPVRLVEQERRIRQEIVDIDRRVAEADRRLEDLGIEAREEAPPTPEAPTAEVADPLAPYAQFVPEGDINAALARIGVTREQFTNLGEQDKRALMAGAESPESLGLRERITEVVEPEAVTERVAIATEPTVEPAAPKAEPIGEKAPEPAPTAPTAPEGPVIPEVPVEPTREAPRPAEGPPGIMEELGKTFESKGEQKNLFASEQRREAARVARAGQEPAGGRLTERILELTQGSELDPTFPQRVAAQIAEISDDFTPRQRAERVMGILRKEAKPSEKAFRAREAQALGQAAAPQAAKLVDAALEKATESAEKVGKQQTRTLKEKAREKGPAARLDLIKEALAEQKIPLKEFVFGSNTWRRSKKTHKDIFLEYLNQRDRGLSRKEAVANTQKKFVNKLSARRIQNLIGEMENGALEEAGGGERQRATPAQVKAVRRLHDELNMPEPAKGQSPELFSEVLRQDPQTAILGLARFLKYTFHRDQVKRGLPAELLSNDPLKRMARNMGVEFSPKEGGIEISARIAHHLGLDAKELPKYVKQLERAATAEGRVGPFRLEGFKTTAERDQWRHDASGLVVKTLQTKDDGGVWVQIEKHGSEPEAIVQALRPVLDNERVTAIDISDARVVKGRNVAQEAMEELGLTKIEAPENADLDRLSSQQKYVRQGGFLYGIEDRVDSMSARMVDHQENISARAMDTSDVQNRVFDELDTQAFGIRLRSQLEGLVKGIDLNEIIEPEFQSGSYHVVFKLKGATTPDGVGAIIRVGRNKSFDYPTEAQRAVVQPILAKGRLFTDEQGPAYYTVHPEAVTAPFNTFTVPRYDRTGLLTTSDPILNNIKKSDLKKEFQESLAQRMELEHTLQLPEGMSLQDNLDGIATLFTKAKRAGLMIDDVTHGPGKIRFDQWGWIPVKKITDDMVGFTDPKGQDWRLVFVDYGTVFPNPETRAGTVWSYLDGNPQFDAIRLSLKETVPDEQLSLADLRERTAHYEDDLREGVDLGKGLLMVNNDRIAPQAFLARHGELGRGAGGALRRVVKDLADRINTRDDVKPFEGKMDVEYVGLTSSPRLSGLHLLERGRGKGRILSNVVEAVEAGKDYDDAVDMALYTVLHEVTHNKNRGHQGSFQTIGNYIGHLVDAESRMDQYRGWVKEGFTREQYDAVKSELVPELKQMRNEHGGRESWRQARIERLPVGTAEGGAPPRARRRGRAAEAAARGIAHGVRPRGALERGAVGEAGRIREAAALDGTAPPRRPKGEAAGPRTRRGTEGAQAEYQKLVEAVDTLEARGDPIEAAKQVLDQLVEMRGKDKPIRPVFEAAWEMADNLHKHMTQAEKDALRRTLPAPRKAGQGEGVFNMLHNPEIPDSIKERTALFGLITKERKAWKRDKIRKWDEVDAEVKELLGIDTPENWTLAFRNKGGGLKDRDVLLLRQIHTELANKVDYQETRVADAVASGDTGRIEAAQKDLHGAVRSYMHAGLNLANGLTGVARALAIGRRTVRKMDPQAAWQADLKAGLRERMRSRFRDPVVAEEKAGLLFNKMMEILKEKDPGKQNWGEFYRAYRAVMGSKLWPDKILEFYKAGLLGWPSRVANITSNGLFRAVRYVEDAVAGGLDFVGSKLTDSAREVYAGEVGVSLMAMRRAAAEAFPTWVKDNQRAFALQPQDFAKAIQKGSMMEDLLQHPGAVGGKFGEFVRFQLKGLGADDELAKHFSRMDSYYRAVYRKLRKGEFKQRKGESYIQSTERIVQDLRQNFSDAMNGMPHDPGKLDLFKPIAEEADRIAKDDTFQKDLGNAGKGFQSLLREQPIGQVFFPFVRTPTNIAKETIARTPLGLIKVAKQWKELTPAQRMTELSKPMTGMALGGGIMAMAMTGEITGGGPADFNERQILIDSGWAPYSVRVGDQWVSYQRFEPIAAILGIAADAAEGVRNGDFDSFHTGSLKVMQSAAENVTNKTFMSGMDALFSAISDPRRSLDRFTKQMQGSVIPNSLGYIPFGHAARAIDATYRQTNAMTMDSFYNKVPFLSRTIDPQYTPTGEERRRPGTAFERLVSPFARRTVEDGPSALGAEEVVRVDAAPQPPKRFWYGKGGVRVPFNGEEKQLFAKALAKATEVIGTKLIRDPNYLRLPDNEDDPRYRYGVKTKQEVVRRLYQKYRATAMRQIRSKVESRARKLVAERD